jgi:Domain of Unknown Function (DUF1080)
MRALLSLTLLTAGVLAGALGVTVPLQADHHHFLGRWNLTGTGADSSAVFWLEVKEQNGQLAGMFLNRGGSPVALPSIKTEGDTLVFEVSAGENRPRHVHRATLKDGKLVGQATMGERTLAWVGVRPPKWAASNANGPHAFGTPVTLSGSLDNWTLQRPDRPSGWKVEDAAMTNEKGANNLVSKQTFKDFRIQAEYKIDQGSNSGIYLRGRYELQVLDDVGKAPESHGHMAIYAWVAPRVNATKPAGEWQVMEATIVGNRVSVTLNGQKMHDNAEIQAITGGALDANEEAPGPIMLQGDHGKVWYRKVVVTPIVKAGS